MFEEELTFGSCFDGLGCFSYALQCAGWKQKWLVEIEEDCRMVTSQRLPGVTQYSDVTQVDPIQMGAVDLVVGGWPCFPAGTLILTQRGLIPIEEVVAGDVAFTHRGRWRRVLRNHGSHPDRLVTIKGQGGVLRCTPNHPLWVRRRGKVWANERRGWDSVWSEPGWEPAGQVRGTHWASPMNFPDGDWVPPCMGDENFRGRGADVQSVDAAWLIGYWVGNGDLKEEAGIRFASEFGYWTDALRARLDAAGWAWKDNGGETAARTGVWIAALGRWMEQHFGKLAHGKIIPVWLLGCPAEWRAAWLEGYLAADGYDVAGGNECKASTVSKRLAVGVQMVAHSLGFVTSLYEEDRPAQAIIEGRTVNQRSGWCVAVRSKARSAYRDESDGMIYGCVRSVEADVGDPVPVWNIEVEEDNSYVADGRVVKNCTDLSIAGKRAGLAGAKSGLFREVVRIAEALRPSYLLLENVPGLLSSAGGKDFHHVLDELSRIGYLIDADVLDTQHFGLAQRRRRIFFVCRSVESMVKLASPDLALAAVQALAEAARFVLDWHLGQLSREVCLERCVWRTKLADAIPPSALDRAGVSGEQNGGGIGKMLALLHCLGGATDPEETLCDLAETLLTLAEVQVELGHERPHYWSAAFALEDAITAYVAHAGRTVSSLFFDVDRHARWHLFLSQARRARKAVRGSREPLGVAGSASGGVPGGLRSLFAQVLPVRPRVQGHPQARREAGPEVARRPETSPGVACGHGPRSLEDVAFGLTASVRGSGDGHGDAHNSTYVTGEDAVVPCDVVGPLMAPSPGGGHRLGGDEVASGHLVAGALQAHTRRHGDAMHSGQAAESGHVVIEQAHEVAAPLRSGNNYNNSDAGQEAQMLVVEPIAFGSNRASGPQDLAGSVNAKNTMSGRQCPWSETFLVEEEPDLAGTVKPGARRASGQRAAENLVTQDVEPEAMQCHGSNVGPMGTLRAGNGNEAGGVPFIAQTVQAGTDQEAQEAIERGEPVAFDWQAAGAGNDQSFRGGSRRYVVRKPGAAGACSANHVDAVIVPEVTQGDLTFIHARQMRGSESSNQVGIKVGVSVSDALTQEGPGAVAYPLQDVRDVEKSQNGLGVGRDGDASFTLDSTGAQGVAEIAPPLTSNYFGDHESREGLLVPQEEARSVNWHGRGMEVSSQDTATSIRSGGSGHVGDQMGYVMAPIPPFSRYVYRCSTCSYVGGSEEKSCRCSCCDSWVQLPDDKPGDGYRCASCAHVERHHAHQNICPRCSSASYQNAEVQPRLGPDAGAIYDFASGDFVGGWSRSEKAGKNPFLPPAYAEALEGVIPLTGDCAKGRSGEPGVGVSQPSLGIGEVGDHSYAVGADPASTPAIAYADEAIGFLPTGGTRGVDAHNEKSPTIKVGSGVGAPASPAVAYKIVGLAQQGKNHAVATDLAGTVNHTGTNPTGGNAGTVAFHVTQDPISSSVHAPALSAGNRSGCGTAGVVHEAIAFTERTREGGDNLEAQTELAYAVTNPGEGGRSNQRTIAAAMTVRRLTPVECLRLQGLPDWWLDVVPPLSDSAKYRQIGNSGGKPVLEWLGARIALVERWDRRRARLLGLDRQRAEEILG